MIQQKFAIPAASLVLALIGLALGVSHRKDGRFASFVARLRRDLRLLRRALDSRAAAITGRFPAGPGAVDSERRLRRRGRGAAVLAARLGGPAGPHQHSGLLAPGPGPAPGEPARRPAPARGAGASSLVIRVPHLNLPAPARCSICMCRGSTCGSSASGCCRCSASSTSRPSWIWPTSCFAARRRRRCCCGTSLPDAAVHLLHHPDGGARGDARHHRPDDEEQRAHRHARVRDQPVSRGRCRCCCSPSRASAVLFGLQERVLAVFESRGRSAQSRRSAACRRRASARSTGAGWSAENGDIYHYDFFDAKKNEFRQFTVYHLDPAGGICAR